MATFKSQIENIMPAEELRFQPTPAFGRYKKFLESAISHPAKANTKLLEFLIKKFTKEGETILDPMCGSGSTGVVAALLNRNAVQVDIERKFVDWAEEAKRKVEGQATLTSKGKIRNICGDSRRLSLLLKEVDRSDAIVTSPHGNVDAVITSPPYSQTISRHAGGPIKLREGFKRGISTDTARSYDAVITSPPYGEAQDGHGIAKEGYRGKKHSPTDLVGNRSYMPNKFESPENISRLKYDAIITSPPYAETYVGGGDSEKRKERLVKAGHDPKDFLGGKARNAVLKHYSEVDAIITSPPYAESAQKSDESPCITKPARKGDIRQSRRKPPINKYSESKENIGNLQYGKIINNNIGNTTYIGDRKSMVSGIDRRRGVTTSIKSQKPKMSQGLHMESKTSNLQHGLWNNTRSFSPFERENPNQEVFKSQQEAIWCNDKLKQNETVSPKDNPILEVKQEKTKRTHDESVITDREGQEFHSRNRRRIRENLQPIKDGTQKNSELQLVDLPFQADAVITSPPYAESLKGSKVDVEKEKKALVKKCRNYSATKGRLASHIRMREGYNPENPENIGNLKHGNVDAIITSPPFANGFKHNPQDKEKRLQKLIEVDKKGVEKGQKWATTSKEALKRRLAMQDDGYGKEKDNIGNLPFQADAVITSPPYESSLEGSTRHTRGGIASRDPALAQTGTYATRLSFGVPVGYSPNKENIGNLKKETYLEAMLKVYEEMWKVLKPNGLCIVVIKPFYRQHKPVDLPHHTYLLLRKVGFVLEKLYKLRLKQESFWRILYFKKYPNLPKLKHEYILVMRKPF